MVYNNSTKKKRQLFTKKTLGIVGLFVLFLTVFGFFCVYRPGIKIYADVKLLKDQSRLLKDAAATQDLDQLKVSLTATKQILQDVQNDLKAFGWARVVPFAASYYGDATHGVTAGIDGVNAGIKAVDALYPYAGTIGLKTAETEAFGSMKEKMAALLTALPQMSPALSLIKTDLDSASKELAYIDPGRYPNKTIKGINVKEILTMAKDSISGLSTAFPDLEKAFVVLPPAFGAGSTQKTYLLMFQNDKELRPTGGFWTAYALATFKNGQLVDIKSSDIYDVDSKIGLINHPAAPAFFQGFLDVDYFYARDANISPDFYISALEFQKFWKLAGEPKVDGMWALDTYTLQELMKDLGKIEVEGYTTPFDEANVVERLETYATVLLKEQAGRKNLIGELMNAIMQKTFSAPQKDYPILIGSAVKMLNEKHILLSFSDPAVQALVEKYNLGGRIRDFNGDYLHINNGNFGGMKANWFVTETVVKELQNKGGQLTGKVTINYINPGKYNTEWNTGYKDIVRVYVPSGSNLLSSSGSLTTVTSGEEFGKTYFKASVLVKPDGGTATLTFDYTLPSSIVTGSDYKLLIQKQPGTGATPFTVKINGKEQKLTLDTDKELSQKI